MRVKYEYAGTNATAKYLVVWFEIVTGSARVIKELRIPWSELSDTKIMGMIDKQVREELKAAWTKYEDCAFDLFNED
uniref:Uncharacterized protein n=1 Tax=uncultured prokaryote TaxID=198431 RepID=A0A0H5Q7N4_9ZZZZ|nr:hypothetical protein [uncultured prokaryote]